MKTFLSVLAAGCFLMMTVGCHPQVPPASKGQVVVVTGDAPQIPAGSSWPGCSTAQPCFYAMYSAPSSAGACPATSTIAWHEITTATAGQPNSRPSSTAVSTSTAPVTFSYTDASEQGQAVCYNAEVVWGSQNSAPSNVIGPFLAQGPIPGVSVSGLPQAALAPKLEKPGLVPDGSKQIALGAPTLMWAGR